MDCIFCKIAAGEIPSNTVMENENYKIFRDIAPMAPVHLVAIPKKHIANFNELEKEDFALVAEILQALQEAAKKEGVAESGYRIVNNCGKDAGQTVHHIHFHLLGGGELCGKLA